jgi:hypothetical protein
LSESGLPGFKDFQDGRRGGILNVRKFCLFNPHSAPQNVIEGNYGDENQREHQNKQIK